jgi:hypothetical protein
MDFTLEFCSWHKLSADPQPLFHRTHQKTWVRTTRLTPGSPCQCDTKITQLFETSRFWGDYMTVSNCNAKS